MCTYDLENENTHKQSTKNEGEGCIWQQYPKQSLTHTCRYGWGLACPLLEALMSKTKVFKI